MPRSKTSSNLKHLARAQVLIANGELGIFGQFYLLKAQIDDYKAYIVHIVHDSCGAATLFGSDDSHRYNCGFGKYPWWLACLWLLAW